jgi:hypothetical protein
MFQVVTTYKTTSTKDAAVKFAIALAEQGYTSQVRPRDYGHLVVADDCRAVRFMRNSPANKNRHPEFFKVAIAL